MHWTHMMNQPTLLATLLVTARAMTAVSVWGLEPATSGTQSSSGRVATTMHTQCTHRLPRWSASNDFVLFS